MRAAKRLGLHTAYPVFSWDNLTNKGLVHELPEVVLVWNESQAKEAVELQDIPRERVRVLGAWSYDHWFDWPPSTSREEFCARVGLRADRPFVLYVCSSGFVARDEVAFVRRWLAALRARGNRRQASSSGPIRGTPRSGRAWSSTTPRRSSGRSWARSRSRASRGSTTSTRSTTRPRWSGSTRARRSRAPSSAARCTRSSPTSSRRPSRGRCTSSTSRTVISGLSRADARRAPRPARGVAAGQGGRRAERAVPARVRPAARARRRGDAGRRRGDRGGSGAGPAPGRRTARPAVRRRSPARVDPVREDGRAARRP